MATAENYLKMIEQQRARIERLENVLALHNLPVPAEEAGSLIANPGHLAFPELDFSEPGRKPPEAIEAQSAIESFPHIAETLSRLWGKDGFDEFLGKLIVDDRGNRKGFSMEAMEELLFLARVARQRKALFGMFAEKKPGDVWQDTRDVDRFAAKPADR